MLVQKYFDIFSYPLLPVEQEVFQLHQMSSRAETRDPVINLLDSRFRGNDNERNWSIREQRQTIAYRKWRRALRWGRVLACLPFVQMIAVCNNLAYDNATDESDIDLFIVTTSGRIWTTRFFVAGLLALLRLRPTATRTRDRLCASFFVSEDHLNLEDLQLPPTTYPLQPHDPYLLFWTATLYPIYTREGTYDRFWSANAWMKEYLPRATPVIPHPWRTITVSRLRVLSKGFLEKFLGDRIERFVKRIQTRAFPREIHDLMNKDTRVVVTDEVLKFHTNDRREEYRKKFYE